MNARRIFLYVCALATALAPACGDDGTGPLDDDSGNQTVCPPLQLAPGESLVADPPGSGSCGLFIASGAGDRYRVAVLWAGSSTTTESATVTLGAWRDGAPTMATAPVRGSGPVAASEGGPAGFSAVSAPSSTVLDGTRFRDDLERLEATERAHARIRAEDRRLQTRLGSRALLPSRDGAPAALAARAPAPEKRTFTAPSLGCVEEETIRGVLILETDHLIAYQDSVQRTSNPVDATLIQRMGDYYRDYGKPVVDDYFGGISDVDGNGKVILLVTPIPADISEDAAAFVLSRDLRPAVECLASNEGEITYFSADVINAMAPGSGGGSQSFQALATLVHEVKHISSLYNRIEGGSFHPEWIEEGTADIAGEMSSRLAWAATGGPAPGQKVAGFTDEPPITAENYGVLIRLARLIVTLSSQPNAMTENPSAAPSSHTYYGSSWHFHRFLGDAYFGGALNDSTFFRRQNAASSPSGVAFIESEVGKSLETLQEELVLATLVNGTAVEGQVARTLGGYSFPTAAEVFCTPNPLGVYPWPVTTTGTREPGGCTEGYDPTAEIQDPSADFVDATWEGPIGAGGMRIHEFESDGTGTGIEIEVDVTDPATDAVRLVVVRLE